MKQILKPKARRAALLTAIVFSLQAMAFAQGGTFNTDTSKPFSGKVGIINNRKGPQIKGIPAVRFDLDPVVRQGWRLFRAGFTDFAVGYLNERDIGGGFRTSRNEIALAENGSLFVDVLSGGIVLKYVVKGNRFATSIRVPGPSPASTDPRVAIVCDAEATMTITKTGYSLTVEPSRLKMRCNRPTGQNITGDLVIGVNNLIATLGGPDFIGKGLRAVNDRRFALHEPVSVEFSKYLGPLVNRNTSLDISQGNMFWDGNVVNGVLLTVTDDEVAAAPAPRPDPPKPPFINSSVVTGLGQYQPLTSVILAWDGGPNYPNVQVYVSVNKGPEVPAYSIEFPQVSPLWKAPKSGGEHKLPRSSGLYKYLLKSGSTVLATTEFYVP